MIRWPRTCRSLHGGGWAQGATLRDLLANRSGLPLRAGLEFDFAGRGGRGRRCALAARCGCRRRRACGHVLVVHERGLVPARACDRDRDGRCLGGRDAASPRQHGYARDDLRHRRRHEAARIGARGHGRGPGAGRAVGRTRVRTGRHDCRLDGHGSSSVRRLAPRGLVTRRVACSARGGFDLRLAGLLVSRLGQVRLGGWSGLGMGRRRQRRAVGSADHAGTSGRRRLDDERQHRACDVPLALRRSDGIVVRDRRPAAVASTHRPVQPATSRASPASTRGPTGGWRSRPPGVASSSRARRAKRRRSRSMSGPSSSTPRIRTTLR